MEPNISNFDKFLDETLDRISTVPLDILYEKYFKYSRLEGNQSVTTGEIQYNETTSRTFNFPSSSGNHLKDISNVNNRKNNKKRSFKISRSLVIGDADSTHCPRINMIEKQDLPGTWVECNFCSNWRYLPKVYDPSQLNGSWSCTLNPKYFKRSTANSTAKKYIHNPFEESEDLSAGKQGDQFIFEHFSVGSVVWVKIQGYPDWPGMVCYNSQGRYAEFDASSKEVTYYYVVFLNPKRLAPKRFWRRLQAAGQEAENALLLSVKPKRFWRRLQAAGQEAENALLLSVKNRIAIYGYQHKYEDIPVKISSQVKNSSRLYQEKSQTISNEIKRKRVYKRKIPPIHSCSINENSNRLTDYQLDTNSNHTSNMIRSSEEKLSNAIINGNTNFHKVMPVSNHISDNYNKESNNISLNNNSIEYQQLDLSLKSNVLAKSDNKTFDVQYNNTDINIDNDVLLNDNTCQKMIMNDKISSIDCYSPSFLKPIECDQIMKEFICSIDNCSNPNIETTDIQMNNTIYLEQNNLSLNNYENNKPKSNLIKNQNYFKLTYNDLLVYSNNVIANNNDILMSPDYSNKDTVQHFSLNSSIKILYENIPFYYQYFGSNEA
ncbi:uncharacterized protein DC041_0004740 [Schistosoma bovis]|uniref:Zinc finger CW-type PWWP domain protein 1 n=1 Tax=Schistosoma bovis TaxID=6184 RepID=A0A430QCK0_SCHBO|nr:uncharacterized protein DC041_0004740 [Schistosoma bovis]